MDTVGRPIGVMVVDDHAMVRKGVKALLAEYDNITVVAEADNGLQALALLEKIQPDVVILDLLLPGIDGIQTLKGMLAIQPDQRVILLTADYREDRAILAIQMGAYGYVRKDASPSELVDAIQKVFEGEPTINPSLVWKWLKENSGAHTSSSNAAKLSDREIEVLMGLTKGYSDARLANELVVSRETVRSHISRILQKTGARNRVEAALYGLRSGLVQLEDTSALGEDLWQEMYGGQAD